MSKQKPGRIRCPHCGVLRAALAGRWCDDCERQGDLPLVGELHGAPPAASTAVNATAGAMIAEAFRRPPGFREGLETAVGDTRDDGAPSDDGPAWGALLRVNADVVWRCSHLHRTREGTFACASRERAYREGQTSTASAVA